LPSKEITSSLYKILLASFIMALVTFVVRQLLGSALNLQTFWGIFLQLAISGTVGVVVYAVMTHLLKSPENKIIINSLLRRFIAK